MPALLPRSTRRLTLRPVVRGDAEMLWELWSDPAVFTWVGDGSIPSLQRVQASVGRYEACWSENGWGPLLATRSADGVHVGASGLYPVPDGAGGVTGEIELGHRFARPFWGQGYAGEAAQEVMRWAIEDLGLTELISLVQEPNTASRRIAETCGFELEEIRDRVQGERSYRVCRYRWGTASGSGQT